MMRKSKLRDKFAGLAMQSVIEQRAMHDRFYSNEVVSKMAYDMAENMIAERQKRIKKEKE